MIVRTCLSILGSTVHALAGLAGLRRRRVQVRVVRLLPRTPVHSPAQPPAVRTLPARMTADFVLRGRPAPPAPEPDTP